MLTSTSSAGIDGIATGARLVRSLPRETLVAFLEHGSFPPRLYETGDGNTYLFNGTNGGTVVYVANVKIAHANQQKN